MLLRRLLLALALGASLGACSTMQAASIGINFSGGGDPLGVGPYILGSPQDVTGVVPQTNWNNETFYTGYDIPLLESTGNALATTSVTYSAGNTWSPSNPPTQQAGDRLLSNYLDGGSGGPATVEVDNVPYAKYDVYIYTMRDNATTSDYTVNGTTQTVTVGGADTNSWYSSVGWVADGAPGGNPGNYVEFTNVTGPTLNITAGQSQIRAPIDAIQIVDASSPVPEPASLTLLGLGACGLLGYAARRRKAVAC